MLDFIADVKVSYSKNGKTVEGKAKIKWSFNISYASWGIRWLSISVPNQTLSLDLTEEIYNEKEDRDEERNWTEEFSLEDVDVEGYRFSCRQDICPTELVIPEKGKPYVTFPESLD